MPNYFRCTVLVLCNDNKFESNLIHLTFRLEMLLEELNLIVLLPWFQILKPDALSHQFTAAEVSHHSEPILPSSSLFWPPYHLGSPARPGLTCHPWAHMPALGSHASPGFTCYTPELTCHPWVHCLNVVPASALLVVCHGEGHPPTCFCLVSLCSNGEYLASELANFWKWWLKG